MTVAADEGYAAIFVKVWSNDQITPRLHGKRGLGHWFIQLIVMLDEFLFITEIVSPSRYE